ncbi:1096_t:CDS:2 [Funneliformis mosseae]|uniref:1096_t:CDS:1 n=1 Tax=Funneliformis mosseae TaxID=27381 RepID=A0A9N8VXX2_FUNMO|nr:1096_t:CDS:2 [Funneliformis mosseae]
MITTTCNGIKFHKLAEEDLDHLMGQYIFTTSCNMIELQPRIAISYGFLRSSFNKDRDHFDSLLSRITTYLLNKILTKGSLDEKD